MIDVHDRYTGEVMYITHGEDSDCDGSLCESCGCCLHCKDTCPCTVAVCPNEECGCNVKGLDTLWKM